MFFLLVCNGQSLLQEGKLWSNTSIGTMPGSTYGSYFIKFMGDTTIKALQYKKILRSIDELHTKWTIDGYIREEPTTRKVFVFNKYSQKDMLIYDFSLETGDSILTGDMVSYVKVTNVINATFGSSPDIRKQIYFFDPKGDTRWIEGIGSTWGVLEGLNSFYTTGATTSLICYNENENLIYHNNHFSTCFPQGQELKVDAGNDVTVCSPYQSEDRTQLAGVASGGVEPYTYTWSGKVPTYFDDIKWINASEFLNDTTISNPTFKSMDAPEDWVTFYLKVEDAMGNVEYDSVKIIQSFLRMKLILKQPVTINRGDSVQFFGDIYFDSNFLPLEYTFSPTSGLKDPTNIHGWAKPDISTTYYVHVVNSTGCVGETEYWRVNVEPTAVSTIHVSNPSVECYLNQDDLIVNLPKKDNSPYNLTVSTTTGAIVHSGKYTDRNLKLSHLNLKQNQLYIISIIDGDERKEFKLVGN